MGKTRFISDAEWSAAISRIFFHLLYCEISYEGRYVAVVNSEHSTFSKLLQSREIDVLMQYHQGDVISIAVEEKIQRGYWASLWIETDSCTIPGHERIGWIDTLEADYLHYSLGIKDPIKKTSMPDDYIAFDSYWIKFPEFREWFKENIDLFETKFTHQHNRSAGKIVYISHLIQSNVPLERFLCERDRCTPIPFDLELTAKKIKNGQLRRELERMLDKIYEYRILQDIGEDDD